MPCRDYYDDHPEAYYGPKLADKDKEIEKLRKQISFAESALCAVLRATDAQEADSFKYPIWGYIDFKAAGITSAELEQWRVNHEALDQKHREEEDRKKEKARIAAEQEAAAAALVTQLKKQLPPEILKKVKSKL